MCCYASATTAASATTILVGQLPFWDTCQRLEAHYLSAYGLPSAAATNLDVTAYIQE